jgi:ABC-type transporter Mla subunit MlaD
MSLKANYFKLGLFVIGALAAGVVTLLVIGSGRWFQPRITMETYFDESVQGLDIGSKVKYRGVVIGEVTKISFTYVRYQLDIPMAQRYKYVLVEAQIDPRLIGSRVAAGDLTSPEGAKQEIERGLRVRLAPQGITGTSYLEIDYIEPPPPTLPIDWTPVNLYIPSTKSTVTQFVNAASAIIERLHKLDIEGTVANLNTLMTTTTKKLDAIDTKTISQRTERTLAKVESTLDNIAAKKLSDEAVALMSELRQSNTDLRKTLANPALQKLPEEANAALAKMREIVSDPQLAATLAHLERTMARLDRLTGGGQTDLATTITNLRQITDNLRELSENAKRYPSNVIFGAPPPPLERNR